MRKRVALHLPHLDVAGGLGVHCRMLVRALQKTNSNFEFHIFTPQQLKQLFPTTASEIFDQTSPSGSSEIHYHSLEVPGGFLLANPQDAYLSQALQSLKPDLLYCSYYTGMQSPDCPQIVTFHDAGFLENPAGFGQTAMIRRQTINELRDSINCIHCISGDAQDRICRLLPWPREKTAMIWHALPDSIQEYEAAKKSVKPTGMPYFFSPVGAATGFNRERKNVPVAIKAFRLAKLEKCQLIIAGTAMLSEPVLKELLPQGEAGQISNGEWRSQDGLIKIMPTIERQQFLQMMHHAIALVYPSRYEGFGIPTIEAMALDLPILAAKATSITEVVADAGLLVLPDDIDGFATHMRSLFQDEDLRKSLAEKAKTRLPLFQMEELGRSMIALFQKFIV